MAAPRSAARGTARAAAGAAPALSEEDVAAVRAELAAGRRPTVWFTPAAVGVPAGGSAKVVALDDAATGDFVQVRATGSRDTMFCSPSELTRQKPARKRPPAAAAPVPAAEPVAAVGTSTDVAYEQAPPVRRTPGRPAAARSAGTASTGAAPMGTASTGTLAAGTASGGTRAAGTASGETPSAGTASGGTASGGTASGGTAPAGAPSPGTRAGGTRAGGTRSSQPAETTVTLRASPDGEWTVEVATGSRRTVRPMPVSPAEIAKAARSLPDPVAEAIDTTLQTARDRQLERVERLRAELETAQQALQELSG